MRRSDDFVEADPKQARLWSRGFKGDQVFPRERGTGCLDIRIGYLKLLMTLIPDHLPELEPLLQYGEAPLQHGLS